MDDFEKVSLRDPIEEEREETDAAKGSSKTVYLLREFLGIQQRRAEAYAKLKRGFSEYLESSSLSSSSEGVHGEVAYQQICSEVTVEFNECSKKVLDLESLFLNGPDCHGPDLAHILRAIQTHEKQKLNLTATIQVLRKAGRPSERLVSHENCKLKKPKEHECVHLPEITEAARTEEAEADAQYDNDLNEAITGLQDTVTAINEHLEEVRYEIAALEAE